MGNAATRRINTLGRKLFQAQAITQPYRLGVLTLEKVMCSPKGYTKTTTKDLDAPRGRNKTKHLVMLFLFLYCSIHKFCREIYLPRESSEIT